MKRLTALFSGRRSRMCFFPLLSVLVVVILIAATARINIRGAYDGLYLLKGGPGAVFEVKDTVLLGEYERVLMKIEFGALFSKSGREDGSGPAVNEFRYSWQKDEGAGYIKSFFADGTKLIISFGRFLDSQGSAPEGVFVGGGLPYHEYEKSEVTMNETGMAFFDGSTWRHLWCNANESLNSALNPHTILYPSNWTFLGSKVLYATNRKLIIRSRHEALLDGAPLRMDRFALYRAGDHYFILVIKIMNLGQRPAGFYYIYGDEPWVGDFGTSRGNVGWVRDRLYYYEGVVDPVKYSYAGMFDYGNKMTPQGRAEFTGTANFIEWLEGNKPDLVYFSNTIGSFADEKDRVPLTSEFNRVLMLQWGPKSLDPGQMELIILALGMADRDAKTGMPSKPTVKLNLDELSYLLTAAE